MNGAVSSYGSGYNPAYAAYGGRRPRDQGMLTDNQYLLSQELNSMTAQATQLGDRTMKADGSKGSKGKAGEGATELQKIQASKTEGNFLDCALAFLNGATIASVTDLLGGIHDFYKNTGALGVIGTVLAGAVLLSPAGLAFLATIGPAAMVVGGAMGAWKILSGLGAAATAKTPAERVLGFKNAGRGTFDIGASYLLFFGFAKSGNILSKLGLGKLAPAVEGLEAQRLLKAAGTLDDAALVKPQNVQGWQRLNPLNHIGFSKPEQFQTYKNWRETVDKLDSFADLSIKQQMGHALRGVQYSPLHLRQAATLDSMKQTFSVTAPKAIDATVAGVQNTTQWAKTVPARLKARQAQVAAQQGATSVALT